MNATTVIKRLMAHTPYKIVRRHAGEYGALGHSLDAAAHNSVENINRLFSDRKVLNTYVTAGRRRLYEGTRALMVRAKPPAECQVIGDFGCGPGDYFNLLLPEYDHCHFYGYDFAEATLAAARERFPRAAYEQHDLYDSPPRTHDVVICSQTLEHLLEPELALKHLLRALSSGGVLILTVPDGRIDTYSGHIQFWSPESWKAWIRRNAPGDHLTSAIPGGTMGGSNLAAVIRV